MKNFQSIFCDFSQSGGLPPTLRPGVPQQRPSQRSAVHIIRYSRRYTASFPGISTRTKVEKPGFSTLSTGFSTGKSREIYVNLCNFVPFPGGFGAYAEEKSRHLAGRAAHTPAYAPLLHGACAFARPSRLLLKGPLDGPGGCAACRIALRCGRLRTPRSRRGRRPPCGAPRGGSPVIPDNRRC